MERLKERYRTELVPRLMETAGYKNVMQVPRLEKIVLNIGVGEAIANAKATWRPSAGSTPSSRGPRSPSPTSACAKATPSASR